LTSNWRIRSRHPWAFPSLSIHQALLIDIGNRILGPQRSTEVFEGPLRIAREPGKILRDLQMPVEQVDDVVFVPVRVPGNAFYDGLVHCLGHGHLASWYPVLVDGEFGMPANVTRPTVFHMQQRRILEHRVLQSLLILAIRTPVPARPDRRRKGIDDVGTGIVLSNGGQTTGVQLLGQPVVLSFSRYGLITSVAPPPGKSSSQ
jgi:hypothetical protein